MKRMNSLELYFTGGFLAQLDHGISIDEENSMISPPTVPHALSRAAP